MKIFLDTADIEAIKRANETGLLSGVTTNPSKVLESGRIFTEVVQEICKIVDGPVSAEAVAHNADEIVSEAERINRLASNIAVKVPMTPEGLKAASVLTSRGIDVNVTMVFSPDQALLAMKTGATFVSIVLSRLDKIGGDINAFIESTMKIKHNFHFESQILAASIKTRAAAIDCMLAGVDVITVSENIFFDMFFHPQTTESLSEFDVAWDKIKSAGLA